MTSIAQKTRGGKVDQTQQQEVAHWAKIFPAKIKSQQQSVVFVKKLLTVSLSHIAWLRSLFPEDVYADKKIGGWQIKTLREKTDNEEAKTLSKWLIGAFDAIEKSYLRELIFLIYLDEQKPEEVHEKYTFNFKYEDGEAAFTMSKVDENNKKVVEMSNIRETTRSLLRNLIAVTNTLDPLPKSAYLAIKLSYYDEKTPKDYEPEGFAASTLEEDPMATPISVGGVATNHHGMKLSVATRLVQESAEVRGGIVNNNYITSDIESQSQAEGGISCVCENSTQDDLMITCSGCNKSQHGACYRILSAEEAPAKHICVRCAEDNRPCTDNRLLKMIAKDAELTAATCLFRRILVKLGKVELTNIAVDRVFGPMHLHDQDANRFLQKLIKEGVLEANDQESYDVCRTQLQAGMKRYLGVKTKDKTVNSIVTGTNQMELDESGDTKTGVKRSLVFSAEEGKDEHIGCRRLKKSKSEGTLPV